MNLFYLILHIIKYAIQFIVSVIMYLLSTAGLHSLSYRHINITFFFLSAKPSRLNQKRRDPDESILANMKQYGFESQYLDAIVADAALPLWRHHSFFDAIITDRKMFSLYINIYITSFYFLCV